MRPLLTLLAVTAVLAGCAGPAAEPGSGLTVPDDGSRPTAGKGCVRGVVVDEGIRPIPGAQVRLQPSGRNATADATGAFTVCDLEPGTQFVTGVAQGHSDAQTSIEVVAGEVSQVRLLLVVDRTPQPYAVTLKTTGFVQAWGGIGQFFLETVLDNGTGLCQCRLSAEPDANLTTVVAEAFWSETTPDPAGLAEYYMVLDDGADLIESVYCKSPCQLRVEASGAGYTAGNTLTVRLDGPDAHPSFQQPFELFLTMFHRAPAPEGWTIADA